MYAGLAYRADLGCVESSSATTGREVPRSWHGRRWHLRGAGLEATGQLIGALAKIIHRQELGEPARCPRCDSYRLHEDVENDETNEGFWNSDVCAACGWRSERVFTSWVEHFEGTDVIGYLSSAGTGVSDRLHPKLQRVDEHEAEH